MQIPEKVQAKLRELPDKPGCYLMRDRRGRIIYVGKAASLRKRVSSYFREASLRRGSPKLRGLVKCIEDIDIMLAKNEAEAVLTEGRLIKEYRPRFNVSFKDDKRFLLLRVDLDEPYPAFRLCRIRRDDRARYFGPYASASAARTAMDFVEKKYGLRKCSPRVPDEQTYRHCMNDIVRFCSAPCMQRVSDAEYRERVEEACAFLSGERPGVLRELHEEMSKASQARDFEQAVLLRDTYLYLQTALRQRARVTPTPEEKRTRSLGGVRELRDLLELPALPTVIEGFDISNISGTHAVASMVAAVDGMPQRNRYRRFRIKTVEGIDDPAMMAEAVRRRYSRLQAEGGSLPGLVLVDGGITQLRAARRALQELGLESLPTAGLAKRFEEIYWKEGEAPLVLPRNSEALKILQRLRDEAHRFALTYHRRLRSRRIRESVLDEIPGIGGARKQELLKHFGSIYRLGRASLADIEAVKGVGPGLAREIFDYLRSAEPAEESK